MFDFPKAIAAVGDLDSRLEQIANQGKITNGVLALLVLATDAANDTGQPVITTSERTALVALVRTAFTDTTRLVRDQS